MSLWQDFEKDCLKYLFDNFNKYASFEAIGGADSTVSDIKVVTKTNKEFFIEVKHSPAQCGQFVLIPNDKTQTFEFSNRNASRLTPAAKEIINNMNLNYIKYKNAGTAGQNIEFENSDKFFAKWIIEYYKNKETKFIITNNYLLFHIKDILNYFDIGCQYRIKKSGSSSVGMIHKDSVIKFIDKMKLNNYRYSYNNGNLIVFTTDNIDKKIVKIESNSYMFSKRSDCYEIRKLSNTKNANVIFTVNLKSNLSGISNQDFIKELTQ